MVKRQLTRLGASAASVAAFSVISVAPAAALVNTSDIANGAVTSAKLANSSVGTNQIATGGVSTSELRNLSVTNSKLGVASVTTSKLAADAVNDARVADNITIAADKSRVTSDTGSFQPVAGDLTLAGNAGSSTSTNPKFQAGVMGNVHGNALTASSNYNAGVIGAYSVTSTNATTYPAAGVLGLVGSDGASSGADGAFVAVLDGDSGVVTANAAYGVDYLNSTAGSKFSYGVDLKHTAHDGFAAVSYSVADIRLSSGATIGSGTTNPTAVCVVGSLFLNTTDGKLYVCTATTPTWTVVGTQS
jgi:hypothetical protein